MGKLTGDCSGAYGNPTSEVTSVSISSDELVAYAVTTPGAEGQTLDNGRARLATRTAPSTVDLILH